MRKKILSIFLVLCLVVTLLPAGAFADSAPTSGTCGDNLTWRLNGSTLTISGKGDMEGYSEYSWWEIPWNENRDRIITVVIEPGVTSIGGCAFYECYNLKSISIPSGVTKIGYSAFRSCTRLETITIPDSVTYIGDFAFWMCSALKYVELPSGITSIQTGTFWKCVNLQSVIVPYGVISIENAAFDNCSRLKSITIPATVTSLGLTGIFEDCSALKDIYYSGAEEQWEELKADMWDDDREELEDATVHYNFRMGPKAPTLKITTSAGKPKLSWNAVNGAVKYWIYRSTDGVNFKYYDSTTSTSYTNKSTSVGTTYYYKVKAVGIDGATSDLSVTKNILCKPAAPTVSINRSNGKPKLSWKAVSGATKYWIYRSTDGVNFKYFDSTTKTSYTNSGAASGTKYYYRVKAVAVVNGKNVTSANSSTKSLFTSLAKPSVSITTSNGKPKITWKAVTGADKYYIYRSTDGTNFKYFDSTTKTSYTNTGAKKNTKYYYKVKAVCASNSNANSPQSSTVSIKATK